MPYDIRLVNMPFSALQIPAIGLEQLRSVIEDQFIGKCSIEVNYLNHRFGDLLGFEIYARIAESMESHVSGLGEWLFRQAAFPGAPDNEAEYLQRYSSHFGSDWIQFYRTKIAPLRDRLEDVLQDLIDAAGLDKCDMVGITTMFSQNMPSFALARLLKQRNLNQLILLGGANCEGPMGIEIIHQVPSIDFVFSGHALVSFPRFVEYAINGDLDMCHRIDGVFSRSNSRSVATLADAGEQIDWAAFKPESLLDGVRAIAPERPLDEPVRLDYDNFLESYEGFFSQTGNRPQLLFETSRGCWWGQRAHCTFCGLNGGTMAFRAMAADSAIATIEGMIQRYAGRVDRYASVDNIMPKEYVDEVFARLNVPSNVVLFYEVKADMREEQLSVLAGAQVRELQPGIEAMSTSTLKLMRKGTTAFNNIRFLIACLKNGIKPLWNLLIGFPGETDETYEEYLNAIPLLTHLPPPSGVFPVRFDRFSPYFTQPKQFNLDLAPLDYYALTYPFPRSSLMNMAYYFRDENVEAPYQKEVAKYLAPLSAAVKRWQVRYEATDGLRPAKLEIVESPDGLVVEDSRAGYLLDTLLEPREVELLEFLVQPQSETVVAQRFGDVIDLLDSSRLLFHERGRVATIVPITSALRQRAFELT